jgi:hypothetical protein
MPPVRVLRGLFVCTAFSAIALAQSGAASSEATSKTHAIANEGELQ